MVEVWETPDSSTDPKSTQGICQPGHQCQLQWGTGAAFVLFVSKSSSKADLEKHIYQHFSYTGWSSRNSSKSSLCQYKLCSIPWGSWKHRCFRGTGVKQVWSSCPEQIIPVFSKEQLQKGSVQLKCCRRWRLGWNSWKEMGFQQIFSSKTVFPPIYKDLGSRLDPNLTILHLAFTKKKKKV